MKNSLNPNVKELEEIEKDISYFYGKLMLAKTDEEKEKIRKQIALLEDSLVIYRV